MAVLFGRGWWNEQEERVLRLNGLVARVLDENPGARRATLVPPVCNGLVCFSNFTAKSARTVGRDAVREPGANSVSADRRRTRAHGR